MARVVLELSPGTELAWERKQRMEKDRWPRHTGGQFRFRVYGHVRLQGRELHGNRDGGNTGLPSLPIFRSILRLYDLTMQTPDFSHLGIARTNGDAKLFRRGPLSTVCLPRPTSSLAVAP